MVVLASGSEVVSLEPLKGMTTLQSITLRGTRVTDLSPLDGLELTAVDVSGAPITDVSPLVELPLTELQLSGCEQLRDVAPLVECRTLERLTVPVKAKGIEALRDHPKLKKLAYQLPGAADWSSVPTITEFWKAYDARRNR